MTATLTDETNVARLLLICDQPTTRGQEIRFRGYTVLVEAIDFWIHCDGMLKILNSDTPLHTE